MNDYLWVIGSLLFLITVWSLWSILKVYFQSKALARVEIKVNRIARRLVELSCASNDPDSKIYKGLVQNVDLQELWTRVRTRIRIGTKNSPRDAELVVKLHRVISEIESLIQNVLPQELWLGLGIGMMRKSPFSGTRGYSSEHRLLQSISSLQTSSTSCGFRRWRKTELEGWIGRGTIPHRTPTFDFAPRQTSDFR